VSVGKTRQRTHRIRPQSNTRPMLGLSFHRSSQDSDHSSSDVGTSDHVLLFRLSLVASLAEAGPRDDEMVDPVEVTEPVAVVKRFDRLCHLLGAIPESGFPPNRPWLGGA
jgi:hypothetical protein